MEAVLSGRPIVVDPLAVDGERREPYRPPARLERRADTVPYAELHCHTNFSFLDGASHPEELVEEAVRLGLTGARDHRPRRLLRRGALLRGGPGARPAHDVRRRAVARPARAAERRTRPGRPAPARAGPRPRGLRAGCARVISEAHLRGGEKGRPVYDLERAGRGAARPRAGADRLPQGARARGRWRRRRGRPRAPELDRLVGLFGRDTWRSS